MATPLNDGEWNRFWTLLGQGEWKPEEYKELGTLHAAAQRYIDEWKPDPKLTSVHLTAAVRAMARMLEGLQAILPAAGGLTGHVADIKAAVENMSVALNGPANIPPMPPKPDMPEPEADKKLPDPAPIKEDYKPMIRTPAPAPKK